MNENRTLSAAALQFSVACSLCTIAYMILRDKSLAMQFYPLTLLVYAPAIYGVNRLFLHRRRSMLTLVFFNAVLICIFFLSAFLLSRWESPLSMLLAGLFCLWLGSQGAHLAYSPPTLRQTILCLDSSVIVLLAFSVSVSLFEASLLWIVPAVAGCAVAILGVIGHRISRPLVGWEWGIMLLAFCGLFAAMWFLAAFIAEPAGSGVVTLWQLITAFFKAASSALWQAFLWFLSLFPDRKDIGDMDFQVVSEDVRNNSEAEVTSLGEWMILAVCAVLLLIPVIRGLKKLAAVWVNGRKAVKAKAVRRQRISLWQGLRRLWSRCRALVRMRLFLWKKRNTPQGLYFILVRRSRISPWRKRPGETPREFLLRLRDAAEDNSGLSAALDEMIPALDAALYSRTSKEVSLSGAKRIRREFSAAAWHHKLRSLAGQLRQLLQKYRRLSKEALSHSKTAG